MFKQLVILLFCALINFSTIVCASYEYAVIPTQKKAENIIKQLNPLFSNNAKLSGKGYQLIIKASPDIIKEIKYVLKQIDRPLQNLIISISNSKTIDKQLKSTAMIRPPTSKISAAENGISHDIDKPGVRTSKIISTQRDSDTLHNSIYTARVVEGNWVTIYTGKQVPYYINSYYRPSQTQFKDIESGFEAKAVLQIGNQVLIHIRTQNNHQNKTYQQNMNTRSASTTLSGSLNKWIEIGAISKNNNPNSQNTYQQYSTTQYRNRNRQAHETFYIKINTVN